MSKGAITRLARCLAASAVIGVGTFPSTANGELQRFFCTAGDPGDWLGWKVSGIDDFNGDGKDDIAIGAPQAGADDRGRVFICFGGTPADSVSPDLILEGQPGDFLGAAMASAGDWDADGYVDLVVGATGGIDIPGISPGRALIYRGGPAADTTPDFMLTGIQAGSEFGYTVDGGCDVNDDGWADVIVGAWVESGHAGRLFVYFGGPVADTVPDLTVPGAASGAQFGQVFACGDVNGDDIADILAYQRVGSGRVDVFFGGSQIDLVPDLAIQSPGGVPDFGGGIAWCRDFNGDGYGDLAAGAPGPQSSPGEAFVYFGGPGLDGVPDLSLVGRETNDNYGHSLASVDVNCDRFSDLVVEAHRGAGTAGVAYLYLGGQNASTTAAQVLGGFSQPGEFLPFNVASAGDFDANGAEDVLLGSFRGASDRGRACLLTAQPGCAPPPTAPEFCDATGGPLGDGSIGTGVAWGDFDQDGYPDIYLANVFSANRLFRNMAGTSFTDATSPPLGDTGNGRGVAWGDYDNDGDLDLFLANCEESNKLFQNEGGGVFSDATTPVLADAACGRGVAWGDYDNDGDLDLFVANDLGSPSRLFRNDGVGGFVDVASGALRNLGAQGWAVSWGDYDNDGDLDLYIGNICDNPPCAVGNRLLRNDGGGNFTDATTGPLGFQYVTNSVSWGDYDNDGDLDLYISSYFSTNKLLRNDGGDVFWDATTPVLGDPGATAGSAWADYDNDGDLDLYFTNYRIGTGKLLRNDGGGDFADVTTGGLGATRAGTGVAWADYDLHGDLDLYVANAEGPNKLFQNCGTSGNRWLHVDLVGTVSNRAAIGARVRVVAGGRSQIQEVSGGSGYLSQNSLTAEFGLSTGSIVDTLEVRWPSGIRQVILDVAVDQRIVVVEALPSGNVAGTVTADGAPLAGVRVVLEQDGESPRADETDAGGSYEFLDAPAGPAQVAIEPYPAGYEPVSPPTGVANIVVVPEQTTTQDFTLAGFGDIAGVVFADGAPLAGVVVDVVGRNGYVQFTGTDADGAYYFAHAPAGPAEVSIVVPLGYGAVDPGGGLAGVMVVAAETVTRNFSIETMTSAGPARSVGYWKHQANVYVTGRGSAQETRVDMEVTYPTRIFEHFYENELSSIAVLGVTYVSGPSRLMLESIHATLNIRQSPMVDRAKQQYLAVLLNMVSNRLRSTEVVSADGATASQAIQQVAREINDGLAANDEGAKDVAEALNNGVMLAAGVIDLTIPSYAFTGRGGSGRGAPVALLDRAIPNPMRGSAYLDFEVMKAGEVRVEVFDVAGRHVRTVVSGQLQAGRQRVVWDGMGDDGREVANGSYFYRIEMPERVSTTRFVVMR